MDDNVVAFPTFEPRLRPEVQTIFDLLRDADETKLLEFARESLNFVTINSKTNGESPMNDQARVNALATAFFSLGRILNVRMCMDEAVTS